MLLYLCGVSRYLLANSWHSGCLRAGESIIVDGLLGRAPAANRSRRVRPAVRVPVEATDTLYMKDITRPMPEQEPIGIVISRGVRGEQRPVFTAFVWGPAPELTPTSKDNKAA